MYVLARARRVHKRYRGRWSNKYRIEAGDSNRFRAPDRGFVASSDAPVIEIEIQRKQGRRICSTDSLFYNWQSRRIVVTGDEYRHGESFTFNGVTLKVDSPALREAF